MSTRTTPTGSLLPTDGSTPTADHFASFAAAIERREDLIENLVDRLLELWHQSDSDQPFTLWAGITDEQYAAYVTQRYEEDPLKCICPPSIKGKGIGHICDCPLHWKLK